MGGGSAAVVPDTALLPAIVRLAGVARAFVALRGWAHQVDAHGVFAVARQGADEAVAGQRANEKGGLVVGRQNASKWAAR